MKILFADPGKRAIGWCIAVDGRLTQCGFHSFESHFALVGWLRPLGPFEKVICEMPQSAVKSARSMSIQNDVLDVATTAGAVASLAPAGLVHPSTWKGGMKKEIRHPRIF